MSRIPLSRGMSALVDDADADFVGRFRWHVQKGPNGLWYARRTIVSGARKVSQLMHAALLEAAIVDHINGDGLDNRRENLRPATRSQNMANRRKLHGLSQFKGVSWCERDAGWRARITVGGRQIFLGRFADQESAARCYDAAARAHFGDFAALNFPGPGEQPALFRASA